MESPRVDCQGSREVVARLEKGVPKARSPIMLGGVSGGRGVYARGGRMCVKRKDEGDGSQAGSAFQRGGSRGLEVERHSTVLCSRYILKSLFPCCVGQGLRTYSNITKLNHSTTLTTVCALSFPSPPPPLPILSQIFPTIKSTYPLTTSSCPITALSLNAGSNALRALACSLFPLVVKILVALSPTPNSPCQISLLGKLASFAPLTLE